MDSLTHALIGPILPGWQAILSLTDPMFLGPVLASIALTLTLSRIKGDLAYIKSHQGAFHSIYLY